jgi:hypothetical protein
VFQTKQGEQAWFLSQGPGLFKKHCVGWAGRRVGRILGASESGGGSTMVMMPGVTRPVDLPNGPTKRLNLPFIGILLPLEEFEQFQDFFHPVQ